MASPPAPKRSRLLVASGSGSSISREGALAIAQKAASVEFPWDDAVPDDVTKWFEMFAKAHNTRPEFVLIGALTTTAAIMGPKSHMRVSSTYVEPTNIYAICIAQPGAGKSQAFRISISDPVNALTSSAASEMVVDDYTRQGLFRHLRERSGGRALVAQEEMTAFFDLVQRRQLEGTGERQLYCRLYDAGGWIKSTGGSRKGAGREEISECCVCIGGFLQPVPFIQKQYAHIYDTSDGFADRILFCTPQPHLLKVQEVQQWVTELEQSPLQSLKGPCQLIEKWHPDTEEVTYTLSDEAMLVYSKFADEIVELMNTKWGNPSEYDTIGNVSKDVRTLLRLSCILHTFYLAMQKSLQEAEDEASIATTIEADTVKMAVALTEYFQDQRRVYEEGQLAHEGSVRAQQEDDTQSVITRHILSRPGPFTTPRSVYKSIRFSLRGKAQEKAKDIMKQLSEDGMGVYVAYGRNESVYFKPMPNEEMKDKLAPLVESWEHYRENFTKRDATITASQYNRLISKAPHLDDLIQKFDIPSSI